MIVRFVKYVTTTGEILATGNCPEEALSSEEQDGLSILQVASTAGIFTNTHKVVDGEVVPL